LSDAERDPVVRRAIEELRRMPHPEDAAVSRVVAAAAAARVAPADDETMVADERARRGRRWTLVGVAAVAAFAGFVLSNFNHRPMPRATTASAPAAPAVSAFNAQPATIEPVAGRSMDVLPIARQFVFNSRIAHTVSVVGDFNKWNPESARMTRASDGDLWSVTVPILPGRHMYAFMVDDSIFVLDPREPTARDADLGVEASVMIVGRP
jgi:hypothetical protein